MATLVFLHAHPDDEASQTGGTMALAGELGHRVVWICCTDGSQGTRSGETDESVAEVRRREARASAEVLGVDRLVFLDHLDSGMHGWDSNANPDAFMNADPLEVGRDVARLLDEEDADVLIGYDWHGNYGHPDHIMVHKVMNAAADLAARRPRLLQSTMNRDAIRAGYDPENKAGFDPDAPADDGNPVGTPEAEIAWKVNVNEVVMLKREALAAHASQEDAAQLIAMPEGFFALAFRHEYYIEDGVSPMREAWPF
ncbi:PIG-L deacetylase family protein [Propionibacteriaceae bacterium G1746]|uniref:PIG-L deacetylase family protein n=1 Tax=Aestuariimicrobium sp. G57 TaxID=3418485 RepID=UPI003C26E752